MPQDEWLFQALKVWSNRMGRHMLEMKRCIEMYNDTGDLLYIRAFDNHLALVEHCELQIEDFSEEVLNLDLRLLI